MYNGCIYYESLCFIFVHTAFVFCMPVMCLSISLPMDQICSWFIYPTLKAGVGKISGVNLTYRCCQSISDIFSPNMKRIKIRYANIFGERTISRCFIVNILGQFLVLLFQGTITTKSLRNNLGCGLFLLLSIYCDPILI